MRFYGRDKELRDLHWVMQRDEQQTVLIYGRRRVGKSALIKQCLHESNITSIYFECKQTTEPNNLESLCVLISETFHFPRPTFGSMEELLDFLFKKAEEAPLILVLDEYSYLREVVRGMDSILQSLTDRYCDTSRMKLILCGSFVDVMRSLQERNNPLYGRIDKTIDLKPMDYYESALFYPSFSNADKVRLYSVFGGIPYYNRLIDPALSVRENILALIASPDARLIHEVPLYIRSEIARINNANEVFETLARGFSKFSDILSQSHVSSSPALSDVLEKLLHMEIVTKKAPINDENNRKKAGYYIADNLSRFYYRYVSRYLSQMNIMEPEVFFDRYIAEDFEADFVPYAFETVATQYLIRQNRSGRIQPPFDKIGKYYYDDPVNHRNGEFDVVTQDVNGYVFYETKFRAAPVDRNAVEDELRQVHAAGLKCYRYGFFSRSGFEIEPEEQLILTDINDLYRPQSPETSINSLTARGR